MLIPYENKQRFIASKPVDFRMSIEGLSNFIQKELNAHIHDGSIYVFYNKNRDKIKCLFWDRNGFVLIYKRLDKCTFKIKKMLHEIESITAEELDILMSGFDQNNVLRKPNLLEHQE